VQSGQRASDADRERVASLLREHYSAGRLSDDDLAARVGAAYQATTLPELEDLTLDLPAPERGLQTTTPRPPKRYVTPGGRALRASVKIHATVYALVNLMLIAIWALAGGGEFWPIWSILGWGVGLGTHAAPVLAGVGTRRARPQIAPTSPADVAEIATHDRLDLQPATAPDGTVTILFSDIVGSTELNDRLGDLRWLELLRAHHAVVREQITRHDGFEVKAQGDGFMIAFPSARKAVHCAQAIQRAIERDLPAQADVEIRLRIGMHTGEAVREQDDFYGRNVVLAARIAAVAEPGEILASEVVKQLVESRGDISFGDRREVELKGLGACSVYAVRC
jgi:class 3 adenylate cyclase